MKVTDVKALLEELFGWEDVEVTSRQPCNAMVTIFKVSNGFVFNIPDAKALASYHTDPAALIRDIIRVQHEAWELSLGKSASTLSPQEDENMRHARKAEPQPVPQPAIVDEPAVTMHKLTDEKGGEHIFHVDHEKGKVMVEGEEGRLRYSSDNVEQASALPRCDQEPEEIDTPKAPAKAKAKVAAKAPAKNAAKKSR